MNARRNGHDTLPASPEAEQGLLGCVLSKPELLVELAREREDLFHDQRHALLFRTLRGMDRERQVIDSGSLIQLLRDKRLVNQAGGVGYVSELQDKTPSAANLDYFLAILREKRALRKMLEVSWSVQTRIQSNEHGVSDMIQAFQAEIDIVARLARKEEASSILKIWGFDELLTYQVPEQIRLVGDNEICMGYEGVTVLAGPGSSGKSLASVSLAMAGAIGSGTWFGRRVWRKFRTMILQAENGPVRLHAEVEAIRRQHPGVNFAEHIFISNPPEGGLPFHRAEFRARVREDIERFRPDLVVLDPWSQVATEDAAKEVVDKLAEIRSCFPTDERCPALLIIAHTKKPRPEDVRRGRGLVYMVSGSIALPNTARCVYVLLPWTDDPEDPRVYWTCPKLNNGTMYAASVWHRKFGTFFEHDPKTNPRDWGKTDDDREKISPSDLQAAFGGDSAIWSGACQRSPTVAKARPGGRSGAVRADTSESTCQQCPAAKCSCGCGTPTPTNKGETEMSMALKSARIFLDDAVRGLEAGGAAVRPEILPAVIVTLHNAVYELAAAVEELERSTKPDREQERRRSGEFGGPGG
jgi:hypothetical protein